MDEPTNTPKNKYYKHREMYMNSAKEYYQRNKDRITEKKREKYQQQKNDPEYIEKRNKANMNRMIRKVHEYMNISSITPSVSNGI